MARIPQHLIEQQIAKARLAGALDNLPGAGKPLPDHPEDAFVSAAFAVGFRIMAQAGVLPEEIALRKALDALHAQIAALPDGPERQALQRDYAALDLRHNIAREARAKFLRG